MNVKNHTIGILGSGWVAEKMAITLAGMKGYECLAIASRTQAHADDLPPSMALPVVTAHTKNWLRMMM